MMRITPAVKHLLILNVIIFVGTAFLGNKYFFDGILALYYPMSGAFEFWQIGTHMFMHGNLTHLFFNMFALWMFGTSVEQVFGTNKFYFLYFSSGLGAAIISLIFSYYSFYSVLDLLVSSDLTKSEIINVISQGKYSPGWLSIITDLQFNEFIGAFNTSMVGASGAIMGILVAFGYLFPDRKLMLLFIPFPVKAKYFIPGIIILDLFSAITGVSIFSPNNTAYIAHLGGAFTGFLIMYYWKKNQFNSKRWD